jgi:hypothetical protein
MRCFLFFFILTTLCRAIEFDSEESLRKWTETYHLDPHPEEVESAFIYYAMPKGLFERQAEQKRANVDLVFFFASILHQSSHFDVRKSLYRRASRKDAPDALRRALLLTLWHVASNQNHFLLRRAIKYWWPRPRRELMQAETALDRRIEDQKLRDDARIKRLSETKEVLDSSAETGDEVDEVEDAAPGTVEPPIIGVLRPASNPAGLDRLWAVFHATGDRRSLHQIARVAFSSDPVVVAPLRRLARTSLERAFRDTRLASIFDALYYDLSHENEVDKLTLEFFAKIKAESKASVAAADSIEKTEL